MGKAVDKIKDEALALIPPTIFFFIAVSSRTDIRRRTNRVG